MVSYQNQPRSLNNKARGKAGVGATDSLTRPVAGNLFIQDSHL